MLVDDNTKQILDRLFDTAKAGAVQVYDAVKQAAPEVWKMALRQTILNGIECAFGAVVCLAVIVFAWKVTRKSSEEFVKEFVTGVLLLGGSIGFFLFTIAAIDFIGNPAYWTLKDLLEMVHK